MTDGQPVDGDADLHGEHGAHRGEHTGRCLSPIIKVTDLAWLEFVKPDLKRAETFARLRFRRRCVQARRVVPVAHVDDELAELPELASQILNVGAAQPRVNVTQRPPRAPAPVQ
jgi:hypothetical protein